MKDKQAIKRALFAACRQRIDERIQRIEARLQVVEESRNAETKSSVGDKYETGRAMMQMEEEKSKAQLFEANAVKQALSQIDPDKSCEKAEPGSLVSTNNGTYYLAIGLGKLPLEGVTYYCVSMNSPIGQALRGKVVGEEFSFQQRRIRVEAIH